MFSVLNTTKIGILAAWFCFLPFLANASMYEQGLVYFSQGKHNSAMKAFYLAAKNGEQGAADMLMRMHKQGLSETANEQEAFRWALVAAQEGMPAAQFQVGEMYLNRNGVANAQQAALYWFTKAAEQAHIEAHYELAKMYQNGLGIPVDKKKAYSLFQFAASEYTVFAQKGDAKSQNRLAGLYESGLGVPTNYAQALKWFHRAALNGFAEAQFNMGRVLSAANGDLKASPEEALFWLNKASAQGYRAAIELLAVLERRWPEYAAR